MLITFVIAFVLLAVLDFLWLGVLMSSFYKAQFGDLGRIVDGKFEILYLPAFGVYVLLALGVSFFAILPGASLGTVFFRGAVLGLIIYGVYDMTNKATLIKWPLPLMAVDIAWGTFVCGLAALGTHWIVGRFFTA